MEVSYYPAFINIKEKQCVVIGGGNVAERKVMSLLSCGAKIKIISPALTKRLEKEKLKGSILHICRNYRNGDLEGAFLVVAATSDDETNKVIASESSCLVNVVDAAENANFIVPSVIKRGLLTVAISTSGTSPAMARSIRKELETLYSKEFSKYLVFLKRLRKKVIANITDKNLRQRLLKEFASDNMLNILRRKGYKEARNIALKRLQETISS